MYKDIVVYTGLSDDRQKFTWLCPISNIYGELKVADYLECGNSFPASVNNFNLIDATVTEHRYQVQSPNAAKTEFYLDLSLSFDTLFPPKVEKPKPIEEYSLFVVQVKTTYTSESYIRVFDNYEYAYDCFLLNKSQMIQEMRNDDNYEVVIDRQYEFTAEYDSITHMLSIEGVDLTDTSTNYSMFSSAE